jgi:hypothetical protein
MHKNTTSMDDRMAMAYPALMEKSRISDIYIGPGWDDIIFGLLQIIYQPYQNALNMENAALLTAGQHLTECQERSRIERENLPVITQIKEKYATLRVYVDGPMDDRVAAAISLAMHMSSVTCEKCGNKGFRAGDGWEKTYCRIHHVEAGNEIY